MTATLPPAPSAPPSLDNPLNIGQTLWRVAGSRGVMRLEEGTITDIKGHYAEVTTPIINTGLNLYGHGRRSGWIDARVLHGGWLRDQRSAVCRLAMYFPTTARPYLAREILLTGEKKALRPCQWAEKIGWQVHPKTIAGAMRWLATFGLTRRQGRRKARWQILNS